MAVIAAAKAVGTEIASAAISATRGWIQGHYTNKLEHATSEEANFDEEEIAKYKFISEKLTKELQKIKEGIDILRNQDYNTAKSWFKKAIQKMLQKTILR